MVRRSGRKGPVGERRVLHGGRGHAVSVCRNIPDSRESFHIAVWMLNVRLTGGI